MNNLNNFYFTFGTDPQFPFPESEYLLIKAETHNDAIREFQKNYPNRPGSECYNAAFSYNENEWGRIHAKWYPGKDPVKVLVAS